VSTTYGFYVSPLVSLERFALAPTLRVTPKPPAQDPTPNPKGTLTTQVPTPIGCSSC